MKHIFKLGVVPALILSTFFGLTACQSDVDISTEPDVSKSVSAPAPRVNPFMASPSILVFSKTLEWRHEEGIAGANLFLVKTAEELGYGVMTTEESALFTPENLAKFDIIVFNNFTGDALSPTQETAFENWLKAGGGWLGIHGSGDSSHQDWAWYSNTLLGSTFTSHPADPQFQTARLQSLNPTHPVLQDLPDTWEHNEEWYSFDAPAQDFGLTPLLGLDETTYSPVNLVYGDHQDLRMDTEGVGPIAHPIAWTRCVDQGRAVYSGLGHQASAYQDQNNQKLLKNALQWVGKKTDPESTGCQG
jgi:type 1 glutamine amidotransferase